MKTITFTPHSDLKKLDAKFKAKWAKALMTSVQHKKQMSNDDDSAHCCLCVAARMEGADFSYYESKYLPNNQVPNTYKVSLYYAAYCDDDPYEFADLNDNYLTHPQIAALLRGESVTIEMES